MQTPTCRRRCASSGLCFSVLVSESRASWSSSGCRERERKRMNLTQPSNIQTSSLLPWRRSVSCPDGHGQQVSQGQTGSPENKHTTSRSVCVRVCMNDRSTHTPWPSEPAAGLVSACPSAAGARPRSPGQQSPLASHNVARFAAERPATWPPSAGGEEG